MSDVMVYRGAYPERFEAPERYAGYAVRDPVGRRIGSLEKLFVNAHQEPEYASVRIGFFEFRTVLIPVQAVALDEERRALVLQ